MLDSLALYCLELGHYPVIFPIVILTAVFYKKDNIYVKAACFFMWVMIFNRLPKYLFKVPLFPHIGHEGYGFPSGHMHASAVFYGYIMYKTNNKIAKIALGILICCIGFCLIYCRFHDLRDVAGAIGFAVAELAIYHYIYSNWGDKVVGIVSIVSAIATMCALAVIHKVEFHVWGAFYGLIGTELALAITKDVRLNSIFEKIAATMIAALLVAEVYYLFKFFAFDKFYLSETRFFLVPFIVVGSMRCGQNFFKQNYNQ